MSVSSTDPGQIASQERLQEYACGITTIGIRLEELFLAIPGYSEAELYDDLRDPLGRAARVVDGLQLMIAEGRHVSTGERQTVAPDPSLALELREGADRLSRVLSKLSAALAHHLAIQARRAFERQGFPPSSER